MAPTAHASFTSGSFAVLPGTASASQGNKTSACGMVENKLGGKEVNRQVARCRGGGEPTATARHSSSSPGISLLLLNSKSPQSEHQALLCALS